MNRFHRSSRPAVLAAAIVAACLTGGPGSASACSLEPYMGSTCITAARECPTGYEPMDGKLLNVADHMALSGLLGNTFGGDGRANFGVPQANGRAIVDHTADIGLFGQTDGSDRFVLGDADLPLHTHRVTAVAADGNEVRPEGTLLANSVATDTTGETVVMDLYAPATAEGEKVSMADETISMAGEQKPVYVVPPGLGLTFCIATTGAVPQRSTPEGQ